MSAEYGDVLDLNDKAVLYSIVALDTELNQLHKLCIEQGQFLKYILPEGVSNSELYNLKDHSTRKSPNLSHLSRGYWKSSIVVRDIFNIRNTIVSMMERWRSIYSTLYQAQVNPMPGNSRYYPETSLVIFNKELTDICLNTVTLCMYIEDYRRREGSLPKKNEVYSQPIIAPLDGLLEQLKTKM
jgi:hypothetical protein